MCSMMVSRELFNVPSFIQPLVGSEIRTVEMHTSGEAARIQRSLARSQYDHLRRSIIYEPCSHQDMYGAVLRPHTELVDSGEAHMEALFLTHEGYVVMCGHATITLGRFLVDCTDETIFPRRKDLQFDKDEKQVEFRLHALVGLVCMTVPIVEVNGFWRMVTSRLITIFSVPTFATAIDLSVSIPVSLRWAELGDDTHVTVDVGFGGAFYAIAPASALGFPASLAKPDIPAQRLKFKEAFNASSDLRARLHNPDDENPQYLYGIMVTDTGSNDELPTTPGCTGAETGLYFFGDQQVDRSPTGSVVQARVALAMAKCQRKLDESWTYHSLVSKAIGGYRNAFVGRPVQELKVSRNKAWRIEVSGQASYIGTSTFIAEEDDDIGKGFSFRSLGI
ncbi:proline racemase [Colletotrichum navitas]|uniref:trans-L-3-hydroxyproline dehydratase n=1 Tax=Colletotrichum navitas TaxID=681940 RepID=A0AAD8PW23_9PEZI|nr:proline racemase [Colletotrichum navitas]KAK1585737.1 proline racemase [Colletotrichum navitas]